ncbi:hypothetical protein KXD96_13900 [Mycobacterium sp. SMC-2]|uniref:hypothetical protein n=1 Tax=Mycobacterium sp. SMC-2 TaxID=2857058 RepID=UPI0021B22664|nr:hypothetical protein [Mycobacterium sp. SMC-2]UXA09064.1 hypothetical protein KXD96_13900 [Mycobacterium sp. SMC-2]
MDLAGLSHEPIARPGTARGISSLDRRARRPRAGVLRPEPAQLDQGPPPSGDADPAAPDEADQRQADYFVRLLSQKLRLIGQRIDDYQKALGAAQANGDVDAVANLRRMARIEEQDREILNAMLEKLRRRFARRTPGGPPAPSPRSAVR